MKKIFFCTGLPRSGSSLLMNVLQQNPNIYSTGTCPVPYLLNSTFNIASQVSEFIAMEQNTLNSCLNGFIKSGIDGWFSSLTNKPVVISKARTWDEHMYSLFRIYDNPKFIVCLRDIRDIICSFEKLLKKYNHLYKENSRDFYTLPFIKRIEHYCTNDFADLGRPLKNLPSFYEWMQKYPNNFFICRFEDFNNNPTEGLKLLYSWLELECYNHDLNNISQSEYFENDTTYRALVDHKTRSKFEKIESSWSKMMTKEESDAILYNCKWYYKTFYSRLL